MYIDVKHTIWKRYEISKGIDIEEIKKVLESAGKFDPWTHLEDIDPDIICEDLLDTSEYISPEENDAATVELYNNKHECIWDNSLIK